MNYTLALLDDDTLSLEATKGIIEDFFSDLHITASFKNPIEAMKVLSVNPCDILMIDIRMPGMNGLEFVQTLREFQDIEIIFLTGHDEYAIQAIKAGAFDYLMKPLTPQSLRETMHRFKEKGKKNLKQASNLESNYQMKRLLVNRNDKLMLLEYAQINRLYANGPYTHIYLTNDEQIVATKSLKHFEAILKGSGFIRPHRTHIFNVNNIMEVRKDSDGNGVVTFREGKEVFVTTDCKNQLNRYISMMHGDREG
jgi:two-component system LytT family response regulator